MVMRAHFEDKLQSNPNLKAAKSVTKDSALSDLNFKILGVIPNNMISIAIVIWVEKTLFRIII